MMTAGSPWLISQRSSGKDPVMMVCKKPEALNQSSDSLQLTFTSKADWTKGCTVWHTEAPSDTGTCREVLERGERRRSEDVFGLVLFLYLFVSYFVLFSSRGGGCCRAEGRIWGTQRWVELCCMMWYLREIVSRMEDLFQLKVQKHSAPSKLAPLCLRKWKSRSSWRTARRRRDVHLKARIKEKGKERPQQRLFKGLCPMALLRLNPIH